jgi:hypothetical protein
LATRASCTIGMIFTPTALGAVSGSLIIINNASYSPQTVALSGSGLQSSSGGGPSHRHIADKLRGCRNMSSINPILPESATYQAHLSLISCRFCKNRTPSPKNSHEQSRR